MVVTGTIGRDCIISDTATRLFLPFVCSEELNPNAVRVLHIRESFFTIRERRDRSPSPFSNQLSLGSVNIIDPEPEMVHLRSRTIFLVEPILRRVVVQF